MELRKKSIVLADKRVPEDPVVMLRRSPSSQSFVVVYIVEDGAEAKACSSSGSVFYRVCRNK